MALQCDCHVLTCWCVKYTQYDGWHGRIGHLNHRQINFITEEKLGCWDQN